MDENQSTEMNDEVNNEITDEIKTEPEITGEAPTPNAGFGVVPPIKPVPRVKRYRLLIVAAFVLIGFLLVQLGQIIAANMNPKIYLAKAWQNTLKCYESEWQAAQKNNPVLKKYSEIVSGASEQRLSLDSTYITENMGFGGLPKFTLDFVMINDPFKKQFQFGTDFPLIGGAYFYLSDEEMIISFLTQNYTLDAKRAGEEIRAFFDNNDIPYDESALPEDMSLSYSTFEKLIGSNDLSDMWPEYTEVQKRYSGEWKKLYAAAELTSANGNVTLEDQEVKCKTMTLTFREQDIQKWLSDLYDMAKEDAQLKEVLGTNYDGTLEALEGGKDYHAGDIRAEFFIYKDNVVLTYISGTSEDGENVRIGFGTTGKDIRLNHIEFSLMQDDEEHTVTIQGNHIDKGAFTSEITYTDGKIDIFWDPDEAENNVLIRSSDGDEIIFTFALYNDGVILKPFSGPDSDSLVYTATSAQTGSIIPPTRTTPLRSLNLQELLSKINPFG